MRRALRAGLGGIGALVLLAGLGACSEQPSGEPVVTVDLAEDGAIAPLGAPVAAPSASTQSACRQTSFEAIPLTHCIADPQEHAIAAVYGSANGPIPYGTLGAFAANAQATSQANTIAFAMNGGAFSDDLTPRGYLVSQGERLSPLNRASGEGNFYLKPNGVFFGTAGRWQILTTDRFFSSVRDRPQFGTQSGPMLLVDGELGAAISENGNSRAIRNGVGVDAEGKAHFVISDAPLSFGQLARFFRDEVKATNALFLDANSSSLWDPATGRMDTGRTGPILVVTKKETP
ncbi:MAG: phosphodiester glycosidase family protein [Pseudomonadota bacterium]